MKKNGRYRVVKRGHNQWQVRSNDDTPSYTHETRGTLICICFSEEYASQVCEALNACPIAGVWTSARRTTKA